MFTLEFLHSYVQYLQGFCAQRTEMAVEIRFVSEQKPWSGVAVYSALLLTSHAI